MTQIEPSATPTNQRGRRGFGVPLNSLLLVSNTVFFIFSALAVASSVAVFLLTRAYDREKDRELTAYQASARVEIADASKRATEALERAVAQSAENLKTAERTAQLEKDAAQLRKDTATVSSAVKTVQSNLMPRRLLPAQREAFAAALKAGVPGTVEVVSLMDGTDKALAVDLSAAFAGAGWAVISPSVLGPGVPFPALGVTFVNRAHKQQVESAFRAVGLNFVQESRRADNYPSSAPIDVVIAVGNRDFN
jgi:hypothetical protein